MTKLSYNDLITRTFRDNAIRSVMMIDDDFLPYDELVNGIKNRSLTPKQMSGAERASNLHSFFQKNKKIICDVDSGTENLDVNKIRKSDLIILDYELDNGSPTRSIKLINDLQNSAHMNLVVLYTQETNLEQVWLKIASSLRGCVPIEEFFPDQTEEKKNWDDMTDLEPEKFQSLKDEITAIDLTNYILGEKITDRTAGFFGTNCKPYGKLFSAAICELMLKESYSPLTAKNELSIIGENSDVRWLQSGNVFVVLHNKTTGESESEDLWTSLDAALQRWQPSYYRVLISEMQNLLENESISFDASLKSDIHCQAAWLHKIISEEEPNKKNTIIAQLLDRLTDELKIKIIENDSFKNAVTDTFSLLSVTAKVIQDEDKLENSNLIGLAKKAKVVHEQTVTETDSAKTVKIEAEGVCRNLNSFLKSFNESTANKYDLNDPNNSLILDVITIHKDIISRANQSLLEAKEYDKIKTNASNAAKNEADMASKKAKEATEKEKYSLLEFSAKNVKATTKDCVKFETDMLHALNSDLCLRAFSGGYVTSGTVLQGKEVTGTERWFLCVSPACETVPEQHTGGEPTKRLVPHRLIKLIILIESSQIKDALAKAEDGRHIFLTDSVGKRRAFAVQSGDSHQPTIDFAVVHEHDNSHQNAIYKNGIEVSFLGVKPRQKRLHANKIILRPIAQLRDIYAARFQAVASQHAGRVGVDFYSSLT